jgi:hypothetical protein
LTAKARPAKIAIVNSSVVPPPEPAAASTGWMERFWTAVEEHGWRYALKEIGWRSGLKVLAALVASAFAELSKGTTSPPVVRSSNDVAREVLTELNVATPSGGRNEPTAPENAQTSTSAVEPDPERVLRALERRERDERDSLAARLVVTKGREKTLYAAHVCAALLTVILAFLAVGLVFAGLVPVAVASAAVAILPGSGTFSLRRMWDKERSKQDVLEGSRNEHAAIVDAVEGALSVPNPAERDRLVTQLAERLQERAFAG